ncbi:gamma-mobile-trio recombinase GmtY [Paraglaciecola sp. L1A13]|uniref:gamma-mobile-trio recombinase GmtY n=1 Tax=Paraglaciecola sp. L1A13 TaxID=2686359 RepID=UPI00131D6D33|nr:gamma-mobile-trio recombinase GmtY [Paraglaciecola sp. L1A13]
MLSSSTLKVNVILDNTGQVVNSKCIVTREGVLLSYLKYLLDNRYKSESWKSRSIFANRLLIDYIDANKNVFAQPLDLFREFSHILFTGTISKTNQDPSNLFWKSRKPDDANFILSLITHYTDWLSVVNNNKDLQLNPFRKASSFEKKLIWASLLNKKDKAFLSHLWKPELVNQSTLRVRQLGLRRFTASSHFNDDSKAFPKEKINALLYKGFLIPKSEHKEQLHERINLRDVLITLLMYYGGLRISETAHIYIEDIAEVKNQALSKVVKVYDPIFGRAPCKENITRRQYLLEQYSLEPRCNYDVSSKQFAGWKNPSLSNARDRFFIVYFFPEKAGELFFEFWRLYIIYQRVGAPSTAMHPYAFTSKNGSPYSIKSYYEARKRAVERIGLVYCKNEGTTPHGDRHRYGQNLAESGVSPVAIRNAMHHKSLESQHTYTKPSDKELRRQLVEAEELLTASVVMPE